MSSIAVTASATGTGTVSLVAPVTNTNQTLTLPDATATLLSNATQLVGNGTTTNNNAAAGVVGELISSNVVSPGVSLTTATFANITTISLTAGDWDVSGVVGVTTGATTTIAYINYGVSTTSATDGALGQMGSLTTPATIAATIDFVVSAPVTRLSLASTTTVYLVTRVSFAVSTANAYGVIRARRVR